jgi:hypothetical protein
LNGGAPSELPLDESLGCFPFVIDERKLLVHELVN